MIYACRLYLKNFWEKIKNFKLEVYNFTDNSFSIANCTFAIALFASSNCSPSLSLSLSLSRPHGLTQSSPKLSVLDFLALGEEEQLCYSNSVVTV